MSTNGSNSANAPFFLYKLGITVPQDVTHVRVDPSVTVIPTRAFLGRRHLKEVVLPEGLQEIGRHAFYHCESLEHINFPSTLTAIGAGVFGYCVSLRELKLVERIEVIGKCAFQDCTSLGCINFPSTLTAIGAYAFQGCTSLREVKLAGGVQDIGENVFRRCSSLERITKAFVIDKIFGLYSDCRLLADGTITGGQVVIASGCLESMSVTDLEEVANMINAITNNRERTKEENLERIRVLFAYYELERRKEVTTILELALWKAKVDEVDDSNVREECRFTCGAGIIIKKNLPFL